MLFYVVGSSVVWICV